MGTGELLGKPNNLLGSDLRWTRIPSSGSTITPRFMLQKWVLLHPVLAPSLGSLSHFCPHLKSYPETSLDMNHSEHFSFVFLSFHLSRTFVQNQNIIIGFTHIWGCLGSCYHNKRAKKRCWFTFGFTVNTIVFKCPPTLHWQSFMSLHKTWQNTKVGYVQWCRRSQYSLNLCSLGMKQDKCTVKVDLPT